MSKNLEKTIERAEKDIVAGRNLSPSFESAEQAIAWLNREILPDSKQKTFYRSR